MPTRPRDRGFTLVEGVIVIAIAALVFQLVVGNMGAMIPARAMDSAAAEIHAIRSGKPASPRFFQQTS